MSYRITQLPLYVGITLAFNASAVDAATIPMDGAHIDALTSSGYECPVQSVTAVSRPNLLVVPDELLFQALAEKWRDEVAVLSSTTEIVMSPSYQRIIGMGDRAVPCILRQLEKEGAQPQSWFWALRSITGENPVAPEMRGNRKRMAAAWLEWGRQRYAW